MGVKRGFFSNIFYPRFLTRAEDFVGKPRDGVLIEALRGAAWGQEGSSGSSADPAQPPLLP